MSFSEGLGDPLNFNALPSASWHTGDDQQKALLCPVPPLHDELGVQAERPVSRYQILPTSSCLFPALLFSVVKKN